MEELHTVLWAYHTTPHSASKETLFALAYGAKVMILVKIKELTLMVVTYDQGDNLKTLSESITF